VSRTVANRIEIAGPAGRISALHWGGALDRVPVMYLHPVNTGAAVWRDVADALGGPAVALDYRGHGGSAPGPRYLPEDYAQDALAVVRHLGWTRYHLAAGSIGGAVAVEVAARATYRVASIAGFGATLRIGLSEPNLAPLLDEVRRLGGIGAWFELHGPELVGARAAPSVVDVLSELSAGRDLDTVEAVTRATFSTADSRLTAARLPRPLPPAYVAYGTEDPTTPRSMADELAQYLGTRAVPIPGLGHLPMLEAPDTVAEMLDTLHGAQRVA
jgi:pimeloyl-ACP methyl ester carboxylesterase